MSFTIEYDAQGQPVKNQAPKFEEVAPAATIEDVQSEQTVDSQSATADNTETNESESTEELTQQQSVPKESWKTIRDRAKAAEQRAEALQRELEEARNSSLPGNYSGYDQPQEDLDFNIDDDAIAEGKHVKKMQKQLKDMQAQIKQYQKQSQLSDVRSTLKNQYPDWDKVFNQENLAKLEMLEPEIAYTLNSTSDAYKAGISAYKMIKKLGIMEPEDNFQQDKAAIQRNAAKPKPMASLNPQKGDGPLSQANAFANGLTDDLRKQMMKEMNDARKGY